MVISNYNHPSQALAGVSLIHATALGAQKVRAAPACSGVQRTNSRADLVVGHIPQVYKFQGFIGLEPV